MIGLGGAPPGSNPAAFPALGFDPAPGVVEKVASSRSRLARSSADLYAIRDTLESVTRPEGIWSGQAAQAFAVVARPLPEQAGEVAGALRQGATLLEEWVGALESYQRTGRDLESRAEQARRELEEARNDPRLDLAGRFFPDDESLAQARRLYEAARKVLESAQDELARIIAAAQKLLEKHQEHAKRVARRLNKVIEDTRGLLDRFGDAVGDAVGGVVDGLRDAGAAVWGWVQDNAEFINNIGDAFSAASTVLGGAALLAAGGAAVLGATGVGLPVAAVLGTAAVGLGVASAATSGVALGAHGLAAAAGADVSWQTLALDGAGLVAPGVGRVATRAVAAAWDIGVVGGGTANSGGPGEVLDDLGTYWLPDSPLEAGLGAVSLPGLAVWNAWEEAQGTNG